MLTDRTDNYFPKPSHRHVLLGKMTAPINNTTLPDLYSRPSAGSAGFVAGIVTFYGIVALMAIMSNIFILLALIRKYVPRNTVNVFLASLALSDLTMVTLSLFDCFAFLNGGWVFGTWSCKIQSLFIEVSFTTSTLTLVAVSVERYLLICHPHMKRRSMRAIYIIVMSLWVGGIAICSPLLHGYVVYADINKKEKTKELVCANANWEDKYQRIFYIIYSFVIYVIPMVIMAFAHWRISVAVKVRRPAAATLMIQDENARRMNGSKKATKCYTIREESSNGSSDMTGDSNDYKRKSSVSKIRQSITALRRKESTNNKDVHRREKRLKAIRLLFVVTVVFIALWTPFIFIRLLLLCGVDVHDYIYKFSEVLILSSTAVNGFIYAFMSPPFRKAFISLMCCKTRGDVWSRDSAPSNSYSEDGKLSQRMSRTSTYNHWETRNSTINTPRSFLIGEEKASV